jgi:hypothetical protein
MVAGDNFVMSFPFTGFEFRLIFAAVSNGARYHVWVDGVDLGEFSTQTTDTGLPTSFGNVRTHDLGGYVKNATIEIKPVAGDPARDQFRIEVIRINRQLRVTNQGIIGIDTTYVFDNSLLAQMVSEGDTFALVQLGVNDRALVPGDYARPNGLAGF